MAAGMTIKLESHAGEVFANLKQKEQKALTMIGLVAERYASDYESAVDTGNLRRSIDFSVGDRQVAVGTNVEYAVYIEFGHHSFKGLHFLKKSIENHLGEYKDLLESVLNS